MGINLTEYSHTLIKDFFAASPLKYAIDATLGKGRDALFISKLIKDGKVFGFDVQKTAVDSANKRVAEENCAQKCEFFLKGHEHLSTCIPAELKGQIGCVIFNLGWLPNSDKSVVTKPHTTIKALESAYECMDKSYSLLIVVCYRGHTGGAEEYAQVKSYFKQVFGTKYNTEGIEEEELSPIMLYAKFES